MKRGSSRVTHITTRLTATIVLIFFLKKEKKGGCRFATKGCPLSSGIGVQCHRNTHWTAGKSGNALNFDGNNDYISVDNDSSLNPTEALTIEAWINTVPTAHNQHLFTRNRYENYQMVILDNYDLRFWVWTTGGLAYVYGGTIPDNVWTHVVGTYDGSVIKVYLNGVEVGNNDSVSGTITYSSPGPLLIGKREDGANWFNGLVDEVVIYDQALSPSEVLERYN